MNMVHEVGILAQISAKYFNQNTRILAINTFHQNTRILVMNTRTSPMSTM